jgi:hypothetical protein
MATLQVETFDGLPGGMNLAQPAHTLEDFEARYLQDVLLDYPGLVRRRGPVRAAAGFPTFTKKGCGIVGTITPAGNYRVGVLVGDNSTGQFQMLSDDFASAVAIPWNGTLPQDPYPIVDAKPALFGGVVIGTSSQYNAASPTQTLAFWRGGNKPDYSTGTISFTLGSRTVTGSGTAWLANISSGMYIFANTSDTSRGNFTNTLIGVVKSVDSNTQLTLLDPSPYTSTGQAYLATSIRGLQYRIMKGRITTSTSSTTVTGANTKFLSQGMNVGTWNIYRASDMAWVGRVATVNNEISVTLAANAALALNNEKYVALRGDGNWSLSTMGSDNKVGFLSAFYAGRQWYANNGRALTRTSRVWFSDTGDPEGLDLSAFDGDFFDVSSSVGTDTPIKALVPAYNGLVIIKENETFAITGSSPTTFTLKKIHDDGTLSGMSAQPYGGGVIWAGVDGIFFYDGINVTNLTENKLGDYYKNAVRNMDPNTFRMWAMVVRGHYMLYVENMSPNVGVQKGALSYTPSALTIVINLNTRAFSLFTNVAIRGFVETPADTGKQVLYLVNSTAGARICQAFDLFDVDANDSILCDAGQSAAFYRYGQTSVGDATTFNGVANTKYFSKISLAAPAAVQRISVYSIGQGGGSATCNVRAGIYSDVGGSPSALLGTSNVVVLKQDDGPAFRDYTFTTPVELEAGDYWIGVQVETSGRVAFYRGATAGGINFNTDAYSDGLANPFGTPSTSNGPLIAFAQVLTCGPDFYVESKKFTHGDSMIKKLFKQLSLNYIVQGDSLRLDTVPGLTNIGKTSTAAYPQTVYTWDQIALLAGSWDNLALLFPTWNGLVEANFKPKRVKFLKRSQMMSFRLWQNSPAVTKAQLGPFQLAYKWQRLGRI